MNTHLLRCGLLAALALQALPALGSFTLPQTEFFDFQATSLDRQGDAVAIANGNILIGRESGNVVRVMNQLTGAISRTLMPAEAGPHGFGRAVAASGPICAIGSPLTLGKGSVSVMNHTTGRLIRKITEPATTANARFGSCLAMTADFIAVGAPDQDTAGGIAAGMVFVYSTSTGNLLWSFAASDGAAGDSFGASVALYGNTLAVGAPNRYDGAMAYVGKAYVYDLKQGIEVTNYVPSTRAAYDQFGKSVALWGSRLIGGAPGASFGDGAVHIYSLAHGAELHTEVGARSSGFGFSLAISHSVLVVGAPYFNGIETAEGAISLYFLRDDYGVIQGPVGRATASTPSASGFLGTSVAIDAGFIAAGAPGRLNGGTYSGSILRFGPVMENSGTHIQVAAQTNGLGPISGTTYSGFTQIAIGSRPGYSDYLTFTGKLSGSSAPAGKQLAWISDLNTLGSLDLVGRSGTSLVGMVPTAFGSPVSNYHDTALLSATLGGVGVTSANNQAVFLSTSGTASLVLRKNDFLSSSRVASMGQVRQSRTGVIDVPVRFATSGVAAVDAQHDSAHAIFRPDGSYWFTVAEGGSSPLGFAYGELPARLAVTSDYTVIPAFLQGAPAATNAVVVKDGSVIARKGEMAPGTGGLLFSTFLGESINSFAPAGGEPLFRASLAGAPAATNEGLWIIPAGGSLSLYARKGDFLGDGPGVLKRFIRYWISEDGKVLALVQLGGSGVAAANDQALVQVGGSPWIRTVLREGDAAPGCPDARIGVIQTIASATNEAWAALVTLTGCPSDSNQALFAGHARQTTVGSYWTAARYQPYLLLRKGQHLASPSYEPAKIKAIALPAMLSDSTGALNNGLAHVLSADLFMVASVTLADNRTGIVRLHP